jgi:glycosyltransferase involved in cell wall biosynthesis
MTCLVADPERRVRTPLLSVCILARDEAYNLPRCIASASAVADEIVVYDTGSSDETVQVARDLGAVVVEAKWPGDFASARNAALAACQGTWVLSLDADEELCCPDPSAARRRLRSVSAEHSVLRISIDNATGIGLGAGYASVAGRLFRPDRCRWRGRLHEQLVDAASGELVASAHATFLRITHRGYLADALESRQKAARNLALARAEVADPSFGDEGLALVLLGRALWAAGDAEAALGPLLDGASATRNATARRQALTAAARILLQAGRADEAADVVARLRTVSNAAVLPDILDAGVQLSRGHAADALALLETVTAVVRDDDGYEHGPGSVAAWRADALVALDRPDEAADLLLGLLRDANVLDAELDLLVEALERAGRELSELADALSPELLERMVAATLRLESGRASRLLQAIWHREENGPGATTVLAGAALLARRLTAPEATSWSLVLRAHGLGELCPLVALALDPTAPWPRRRAAAAAARALGDSRARALTALDPCDLVPVVALRPRDSGTRPLLSVVVVARHGAPTVLACLDALASEMARTEVAVEVVVVDPGSRDATAVVVTSLGGDVAALRFAEDPGNARARNAAARAARGEILLFLDAGAALCAGSLDALLAYLESHPRCAAVSALLVGESRACVAALARARLSPAEEWPAHGLARRSWACRGAPQVVADWTVPTGPLPADALVTAHGLAVRRDAFDAIGGFDEGYGHLPDDLASDLDLAMALRARGDEVGVAPDSLVVLAPVVLRATRPGEPGPGEPGSGAAAELSTLTFGTRHASEHLAGEPAGRWWCARDDAALFATRWSTLLACGRAQADRSR